VPSGWRRRRSIQPGQDHDDGAGDPDNEQGDNHNSHPLLRCRILPDHHAAPLKYSSTSIPHSASSHSGTYTRFRLR